MARKTHKHRNLYRLTCEDVENMAEEMGVPRKKLTDDFIYQVQRYIEKGFEHSWYEIVEFAVEQAFEDEKERGSPK